MRHSFEHNGRFSEPRENCTMLAWPARARPPAEDGPSWPRRDGTGEGYSVEPAAGRLGVPGGPPVNDSTACNATGLPSASADRSVPKGPALHCLH